MRRRASARSTCGRERRSSRLFYGGSHERSRRAGTENVPGIVGLGKAAELAVKAFANGEDREMAALRDQLEQTILEQVEQAGVNGAGAPRVPNTTNIYFDYIEGEALVIALDLKGAGGFDRSGMFLGSYRAFACSDRHGITSRSGTRQHSLQPGEANTAEDVDFAISWFQHRLRGCENFHRCIDKSQFACIGTEPARVISITSRESSEYDERQLI